MTISETQLNLIRDAHAAGLFDQQIAMYAADQGLDVVWRKHETDKYDLIVAGRKVDAKTTMQRPDGTWHFRLPEERRSFHGRYVYTKDYAQDCEVIAFVCLYPGDHEPDIYFVESARIPGTVRIKPGGKYEDFKFAWDLFEVPGAPLLA